MIRTMIANAERIGRTSRAIDRWDEAEGKCLREGNSADGFMAYTDWVRAKPSENGMVTEPGGR